MQELIERLKAAGFEATSDCRNGEWRETFWRKGKVCVGVDTPEFDSPMNLAIAAEINEPRIMRAIARAAEVAA